VGLGLRSSLIGISHEMKYTKENMKSLLTNNSSMRKANEHNNV
jgi:hypothetical protein